MDFRTQDALHCLFRYLPSGSFSFTANVNATRILTESLFLRYTMRMTKRMTTIEISKQDFKFSGAHFTVFNATERERLHGHNFRVSAEVVAPVDDNGLCFNYQEIKHRLRQICKELDEYLLLPGDSPHLLIDAEGDQVKVEFAGQTMQFLAADTLVLPIRNTTVEEFSHLIMRRLFERDDFLSRNQIRRLKVSVSSGDGQWGSSVWEKTPG